MNFSNKQVAPDSIPTVGDIEFKGLDRNYLTVELIATGIFWLILGTGALIAIFLNLWRLPQWAVFLAFLALISLVVSSFVLTYVGFKKKKYALREKDIVYQAGYIWRKYTVLPFSRVQHAEVQQGPIERMFDLSRLKIYTAGGSSSDLSIAGLPLTTAQNIKHYILHQTTNDEEE